MLDDVFYYCFLKCATARLYFLFGGEKNMRHTYMMAGWLNAGPFCVAN